MVHSTQFQTTAGNKRLFETIVQFFNDYLMIQIFYISWVIFGKLYFLRIGLSHHFQFYWYKIDGNVF